MALLAQMNIVSAAKKAGVKRFVPCGFATVCPPGGVMKLRDQVHSLHSTVETDSIWQRTERASTQPHKAAISAIHLYRRGLLVPILLSSSAIWKDGRVYIPGHEYKDAWRWHRTKPDHRFTRCRKICSAYRCWWTDSQSVCLRIWRGADGKGNLCRYGRGVWWGAGAEIREFFLPLLVSSRWYWEDLRSRDTGGSSCSEEVIRERAG